MSGICQSIDFSSTGKWCTNRWSILLLKQILQWVAVNKAESGAVMQKFKSYLWYIWPKLVPLSLFFWRSAHLHRKMMRTSWTEHRTNQSILDELAPSHHFLPEIQRCKLKYFGHIVRAENLCTTILHDRINGSRKISLPSCLRYNLFYPKPILIIFGRNVAKGLCNVKMLCILT